MNLQVVSCNIDLTVNSYYHYDFVEMKKTATGISPIIVIDRRAPQALHRQIYDAYRAAIVDRSLRAGQRVPSTRVQALELGISRIPVLTAYAQLLAEGYFESRVGAGTVVSRSLPDQVTFSEPRRAQSTRVQAGSRRLSKRSPISFRVESLPWRRGWGAFGVSQVAFGHFPFHVWNALVTRHCRNAHAKSLDYGDAM
ncbi:MAG: GntR family transcriptional regulator, partial [Candidatus Sulfotelmatobacter sp.]